MRLPAIGIAKASAIVIVSWGWIWAGAASVQAQLFPNLPIQRERTPPEMENPVYKQYRHVYWGYHPTCWRKFPPGWGCPSPEAPDTARAFKELPLQDFPKDDEDSADAGPEPALPGNGNRPGPGAAPGNLEPPDLPDNASPFETDMTPPGPNPLPLPNPNPNPKPNTKPNDSPFPPDPNAALTPRPGGNRNQPNPDDLPPLPRTPGGSTVDILPPLDPDRDPNAPRNPRPQDLPINPPQNPIRPEVALGRPYPADMDAAPNQPRTPARPVDVLFLPTNGRTYGNARNANPSANMNTRLATPNPTLTPRNPATTRPDTRGYGATSYAPTATPSRDPRYVPNTSAYPATSQQQPQQQQPQRRGFFRNLFGGR